MELRRIGNVKDELDLTTGKLTQRIEEMVLDGSEEWIITHIKDTTLTFKLTNHKLKNDGFKFNTSTKNMIICNNLKNNGNVYLSNIDGKGYEFDGAMILYIGIEKDKLASATNTNFKQWLNSNPIVFQYILPTESVKTVDLTVQNQHGSIIPHIQTQQGITHVSTSSDGLTPVVEMSCSYDTIIKPNTTYTIKLDRPIVSDTMYLQVDLGGTMMMLDADVNAFTIKTPSTLSHSQLRLSGTGNTVKEIIVLEGNRINDKIEYFEGMKNVENPILIVSNCPYVFGKGGRL